MLIHLVEFGYGFICLDKTYAAANYLLSIDNQRYNHYPAEYKYTMQLSGDVMTDSDNQALSLQLAHAYIDAGDFAGAREILSEFELRGYSEAILLLQTLPANDYVLSKQQLALTAGATSLPVTPIPVPNEIVPENKEARTMKIYIDEEHSGGFILDGQENKGVLIQYYIVDGESGSPLTDQEFGSYEAAEAYVATNFPGCERWVPPPPSAEGLAELMRMVNLSEVEIERDPSHVFSAMDWVLLSCYLHRHSLDSNTVARIKALLTRVDPRAVAAWNADNTAHLERMKMA